MALEARHVRHRLVAVSGCGHDGRLGLGRSNDTNVDRIVLHPFFAPPSAVGGRRDRIGDTAGAEETEDVGDVLSVHCGGYHTFVRTTRGVFGFGSNDEGQLGLGTGEWCDSSHARVDGAPTAGRVSARGGTSAQPSTAAVSDKTDFVTIPVRVAFFGDGSRLLQLSCGAEFSVALMPDGIYACGSNKYGQLGLDDNESRRQFTRVPFLHARVPQPLSVATAGHPVGPCSQSTGSAAVLFPAHGASMSDDGGSSRCTPTSVSWTADVAASSVTHITCGTYHTVIALRNVYIPHLEPGAALDAPGDVVNCTFYPVAIVSAGSGDFGELGYDGDELAVLKEKDRVAQQAIVHSLAQQARFGGQPGDSASLLHDDAVVLGAGYKRNSDRCKKARRAPFSCNVFRHCVFPLLEDLAAQASKQRGAPGDRPSVTQLPCGGPGTCPTVVDVKAMHLHTSVTLWVPLSWLVAESEASSRLWSADEVPGDPCATVGLFTFHFGCYFNGEIEGAESSLPRLVAPPRFVSLTASGGEALNDVTGTPVPLAKRMFTAALHAGNDVAFRFDCGTLLKQSDWVEESHDAAVRSGGGTIAALRQLEACGSSRLLGTPLKDFARVASFPLSFLAPRSRHGDHSASAPGSRVVILGIEKLVGRDHFLALAKGTAEEASEEVLEAVLGFGENLHGQLGFSSASRDQVGSHFPLDQAGAPTFGGDHDDGSAVDVERRMCLCLVVGDSIPVYAVPASAVKATWQRPRADVDSTAGGAPSAPASAMWRVARIVDVQAGARHSVFLVDVERESK